MIVLILLGTRELEIDRLSQRGRHSDRLVRRSSREQRMLLFLQSRELRVSEEGVTGRESKMDRRDGQESPFRVGGRWWKVSWQDVYG